MNRLLISIGLALCVGCGSPSSDEDVPDAAVDGGTMTADAGTDTDTGTGPACPGDLDLTTRGSETVQGVGSCALTVTLAGATMTEVTAMSQARLSRDGEPAGDEPNWLEPQVLSAGSFELEIEADGAWEVTIDTYGAPVEEIARDRSLVWTDPALVDDPDVVGLGRLMAVAADGDDPGLLFADWLRRFATTAHSERVGPLQFLEEIEQNRGTDPTTWDLDALDFKVTAVHNRVDLAAADSCGELRVSIASTHTVYQPFHAIFLFEQTPGEGDVSPGGEVHCSATLREWARLSELDHDDFVAAARGILDEGLGPEKFLMAETVEFIISPWEWRQWRPTSNDDPDSALQRVFENPRMFQTVDIEGLNQAGSRRDAFLGFVEENAADLDARTLLIPERFRPRSARVNAGVPWVPLELDGVDPTIRDEFPDLRQNIELIGCPACHSTDADFIQTRPDRTFSPFYDKELDARAAYLDAAQQGEASPPPFGPLQSSPVLPP